MAVHFKFRSAVEFDSVDVEGPSVTLRDLKGKIAEHKKLSGCKDFDLVITHAETGEEYNDDSVSVPQNTSVIIKRVPAARPKAAVVLPDVEPLVKASSIKNTDKDGVRQSPSLPIEDNNGFADFGVDLYANSEKDIPETYMDESDNVAGMVNKTDKHSERQRQESCFGHQMLENNGPFTAVKSNEMAFAKKADAIHSTIPNAEVPSELKCSLCQAIFKEAVMIPCCQFSFCRECIRKILIEKGRCPQCNSTKFKIDELLPNIALRQAIEHFLESQVTISNAENCAAKNVPDGESAIQAKAVSQALSNMVKLQRSQSPSATVGLTQKKLNKIIPESAGLSEGKKSVVDNGESGKISKLLPSLSQKDDGITMESQASKGGKKRKKTFRPSATDGTANYVASGRSKKGDHCCYVCGSPDHFARDCPDNSNSFPQHGMFQGGGPMYPGCVSAYGPDAYWHGPSVPHVRPFPNMYGPAPPAMPFEASMVPVAPYGLPPYMPSMYAGVPIHCGFMRMGSIGPALVTPSGRPLSREEFMELQERERWRRLMQEQERERIQEKANSVEDSRRWSDQQQVSEDDHCSSYMKHDVDRVSVGNYSNENNYQKSRIGKHIHKYSREKYPESNAFHRQDSISDESDYQTSRSRSRRHMQRHSREKYIDSNVYQGTNSFSDESDYEKSKSGRHTRKQSHEKYADYNGCQREDSVSKDEVDLSFNNRNLRKFQSEKQHGYSKASKYNSRKHGRHYSEDSMDRSISELEEYGLEPVENCNNRHKDSGHLKVSKHSVSKKSGKTIMLRESGSPSSSYVSHHKSRKDTSEDLKHVSYHKKDAKKYASPDYTEEDDRFVSLYEYPSPKEEKLERSIHHKKQSYSTSEYDHCLSSEHSKRRKKHKNDQRNSLDRTRDTESNVVDDSEVHASRHNKHKSKCHTQPTGSSLDPIEESRWQMNTGFDSENDDMYYIYHTRDKQEHLHKKKAN